MEDLRVENGPLQVTPVTDYDPFEAKFCASLYWLVFRATEDGDYEDIPSQVTSPVQRDAENRITVRPEVIEFLCSGDIYCKVCCGIFPGKNVLMGHRAVIQTLSRNGIYVVEDGDIAVTDSALQQKKPFRKSTHLALMDSLMTAYVVQVVSIPKVVLSVRRFSSFNASKELPFDSEDALLLWVNKTCAALNAEELKKQKLHAEQLLQNQDKAKRFRFRRDQLQPKVQMTFPHIDDLLKDISDGQCLLGMLRFYHPDEIKLEDIRIGKELATEHAVHNLDLFRTKCSELVCASSFALKVEDLLYGSQAMKPNMTVLLAEIFHRCEEDENSVVRATEKRATSASDLTSRDAAANKETVQGNRSASVPMLSSEKREEAGSTAQNHRADWRAFVIAGSPDRRADNESQNGSHPTPGKAYSDTNVSRTSKASFKSPFQLSFTADIDLDASDEAAVPNGASEPEKEKLNPFSGIFQRAVLAGESRKNAASSRPWSGTSGSPRLPPKHDQPLLTRRAKHKPKHLAVEDWDVTEEDVEDNSMLQRFLKELRLSDRQRSQSLTGLDSARCDPRKSLQAWPENSSTSASDTNLSSSRTQRISLDFRPNQSIRASLKQDDDMKIPIKPGLRPASKHQEEHMSQDSLSSSPKSVDSLNTRPVTHVTTTKDSLTTGASASYASDSSVQALHDFEDVEAMLLAGRSLEGAAARLAQRNPPSGESASSRQDPGNLPSGESAAQDEEDLLNASVSSDDMNRFRLEVLQRLSDDRLRGMPLEEQLELDDDDPISLARQLPSASPREDQTEEPPQFNMAEPGTELQIEVLSPIREMSEPHSSTATDPNSAPSTAPSTPCSPLDVAPFMPSFFTTSPANSLDRRRVGNLEDWGDREGMGMNANEDLQERDSVPREPVASETPRCPIKTRLREPNAASNQSKSFEHLARGSYTVDHVPLEAAKAAGIPVIGQSGYSVQTTNDRSGCNGGEVNASRSVSRRDEPTVDIVSSLLCSNRDSHGGTGSFEKTPRVSLSDVAAITQLVHVSDVRSSSEISSSSHERPRDSPTSDVSYDRASGRLDPEGGHVTDSVEAAKELMGTNSIKTDAPQFGFSQEAYSNLDRTQGNGYSTYTKKKVGLKNRNTDVDTSTFKKGSGYRRQLAAQQRDSGMYDVNGHALDLRRSEGERENFDRYATNKKEIQPGESENEVGHEFNRVEADLGRGPVETRQTSADSDRAITESGRTLADGGRAITEGGRAIAQDGRAVTDNKDGSGRFATYKKATGSAEMNLDYSQEKSHSEVQSYEGERGLGKPKIEENHKENENRNLEEPSEHLSREQRPQAFTFDFNAASLQELNSRNPMTDRPQPSPSSLIRSRTFRKKPNGQIITDDIPIEPERVSVAARETASPRRSPIDVSSIATSQERSPDRPEESATPRRVSPVGDKNGGSTVQTSWSDEARACFPEGAEMKTMECKEVVSVRRRSSPRDGGRASPGARISWLTAAASGVSGQVMLNNKGEIEEADDDTEDKSQAVTSQMTLLRMQLEEKRHHIEAEKRRSQEQWAEQRRLAGHTAFWYMMGKARGAEQEFSEGPGAENQVPYSNNTTSPKLHQPRESARPEKMSHNTAEVQPNPLRSPDPNTMPEQQSPPIARSSPIGSPVAWQPMGMAQKQEYETREFRLSNFPQDSGQVHDLSTGGSVQPLSARKCWGVNPTTPTSPMPFSPPGLAAIPSEVPTTKGSGVSTPPPSNEAQVTSPWKGVAVNPALQQFTVPSEKPESAGESSFSTPDLTTEAQVTHPWKGVAMSASPFTPPQQFVIPSGSGLSNPQPPSEIEITPQQKGLTLFVGEESSFENMTPEQMKKKERFLRQRQKKQEEEKARKEDELEKKRRRETRQREEAIRRMEDEKQRSQTEERKITRARPQERGTPSREARPSHTPEGYSTYRATPVSRAMHEAHEDSPSGQKSGFSDFSGPQCYVKPSGKSNRKIIMNAISYVCLSGTVNKDQKDKCLQAIAESGGYHFMVLFKDGLKFRGLYSYNPESDQAFKVFGIGPRVLTGKMVENLYKYNSGGKEFTKIFSKTLSISIDGLSIQKTYWQSSKPVVQSKTMSNLKRAPKTVQR